MRAGGEEGGSEEEGKGWQGVDERDGVMSE